MTPRTIREPRTAAAAARRTPSDASTTQSPIFAAVARRAAVSRMFLYASAEARAAVAKAARST